MIMYYDGTTTTVTTSSYLSQNLADVQTAIANIMRTYNNARPTTKPLITYIRYDSERLEVRVCMSNDLDYYFPFYGITAHELWQGGENVVNLLLEQMAQKGVDNE